MEKLNVTHIDYGQLNQLSATDLAYIRHDDRLGDFYAYPPSRDSIDEVVTCRKKLPVDRQLLLRVLKTQYEGLNQPLPYKDEDILSENTFTITTAHQPALFTGPLFHIYKIASVINMARKLNEENTGQLFLPVFIISGEDHDWKEINHFHLFGRRFEWNRQASGPCGRLSTEGLDDVIKSVSEALKNTPHGESINELLTGCLNKATDYGHFHRLLLSNLFSGHDLIVLDMDDAALKNAFIPVMEKEIKERFSFKQVPVTQAALEKKGFKIQAYCRPLNLFYISDKLRERIDPVEDQYMRSETKIKYSKEDILAELHEHPERFSPNVILRPLYQEYILPNIIYTGGGGEIAYWLERKQQFSEAGIHFPMLVRRNSALIIDAATSNQLQKAGLKTEDMFLELNALIKKFLNLQSGENINFADELRMLEDAYDQLAAKAQKKDATLSTSILAEKIKQAKLFEQLGSRLMRAEKQQQDTVIKRIERIKEKLFPEGGLQERHENFLSYYAKGGKEWIDEIVMLCDPWLEKFLVIEQQD